MNEDAQPHIGVKKHKHAHREVLGSQKELSEAEQYSALVATMLARATCCSFAEEDELGEVEAAPSEGGNHGS